MHDARCMLLTLFRLFQGPRGSREGKQSLIRGTWARSQTHGVFPTQDLFLDKLDHDSGVKERIPGVCPSVPGYCAQGGSSTIPASSPV